MTTTNNAAMDTLRTFAIEHDELAFAHLCTAALTGEEWAVERIEGSLFSIDRAPAEWSVEMKHAHKLDVIRTTDTTRPDGAIARSFVP